MPKSPILQADKGYDTNAIRHKVEGKGTIEGCLIRRWERIGTRGQAMAHHFQRKEGAVRLSSILRGERAAADIGHARLHQDKHRIIAAQFALM